MKIFLTGASGILGTDLKKTLEISDHEVVGFDSKTIQIDNLSDVRNKARDFKPDIIIHSAAMTNVDLCEEDREQALKVNVIGTHNLSVVACQLCTRIVYISSCGIYGNGKTRPYSELDPPQPVTFHHYTKLEGEKRIRNHNLQYLIVRPGWLFGGTIQHKKNFVEARRKEAVANPVIKSAVDKFGSPTYTADLARQITTLLDSEIYGTFNIVNEGWATRFEYVSEIIHCFKMTNRLEEVRSNEFPRRANMPDNEMLANEHLILRGVNKMRPWKDALQEYIQDTYKA